MDNLEYDLLDEEIQDSKPHHRRELLTWWMKGFIWLFMIGGGLSLLNFIPFISGDIGIYGLETNPIFSYTGLAATLILLFKAFTAYALWTSKPWAVKLGIADGVLGILVCFIMLIAGESFRFEILFLGIYLYRLAIIQPYWEADK